MNALLELLNPSTAVLVALGFVLGSIIRTRHNLGRHR